MPAYNAEATLAEAVGSALAGTFRDFELIIVDDGSTDSTADAAASLEASDPRVKHLSRPNGGISAAFNSGLGVAEGTYVARLDSDDLWHPAKLERQMQLAESNRDLAFIYTFVRYIDGTGRIAHDGPEQRFPPSALCRGIYESLAGANSSALILRSAALECGGYDEELASWEDLLLQLKISACGPIAFVPEYLVGYRIRPGSLSSNVPAMLDSWRLARAKIRRQFPHVPPIVDRWAHARRCAEFAEAFAWRGNYAMCTRLLAEAAALDWRWTSRMLSYRSIRRLRRGFSQRPKASPGPDFMACATDKRLAAVHADRSSPLTRLEDERISLLAAVDEQLAGKEASSSTRPLPAAV